MFAGICFGSSAQTIPYGNSQDTLIGVDGMTWVHYYYKPANYDSLTSPILWGIHGSGGNGNGERNALMEMADNRGALIVAPSMPGTYGLCFYPEWLQPDSTMFFHWFPTTFKNFYRHVINRENRDTMWVHLIGFSQGGQLVTRYMLIRQAHPDSIPLRMAVSVSPRGYTFCTDSLNGACMAYVCGLAPGSYLFSPNPNLLIPLDLVDFICNEQVVGYYNENYGVLIGTLDNGIPGGSFAGCNNCFNAQGNGRYERAQNFYAFSGTDAIARGTTLKWQYDTVSNVGHNGWALYHNTLDTASIAEHLLFDSPYYPPTFSAPTADIGYDITDEYCNEVKFNAFCSYNKYPVTVLWDFGDATTSTEKKPVHIYAATGTYTVTLIVNNILGTDTSTTTVTIDELPPAASFDSDTIAYLPNATVQFTNTTINGDFYYWDFGDNTQSNDVHPVHTYLSADTFTVELIAVDAFNGCANLFTNDIVVTTGTGIGEQNLIAVRVYPNPASDEFTISGNYELPAVLELYDMMGRKVKELRVAGYGLQVDVSDLSKGLYIWSIGTARGKVVVE